MKGMTCEMFPNKYFCLACHSAKYVPIYVTIIYLLSKIKRRITEPDREIKMH